MYINRARRHEDLDSPKLTQQAEEYGHSFLRKLGMVSCHIEATAAEHPRSFSVASCRAFAALRAVAVSLGLASVLLALLSSNHCCI